MMFMNFGAVHYNLHPKYYTLGLSGASFSVKADGKTGGAAAGFALPQLARASGQSAHDLWTARRLIHPASSSLHHAP